MLMSDKQYVLLVLIPYFRGPNYLTGSPCITFLVKIKTIKPFMLSIHIFNYFNIDTKK